MAIIQHITITKWLFLATVSATVMVTDSTMSISNVAKLARSFMTVYQGGGGVNDDDDDDDDVDVDNNNINDAAHNNRALSDTTIQYATTQSKLEMIANFLSSDPDGQQVEIRQISASGAPECIAAYSNGHEVGSKIVPSQYWGGESTVEYIVSDNGMILSTGNPMHFSEEQISGFSQSTNWEQDGDIDLSNAVNRETYDACSIEFQFRCLASSSSSSSSVEATGDITPVGESKVSMSYQFASEEYYEPSTYSDTFAIYLNQIINDGQQQQEQQLPNDNNNNNIATLMEAYGESTPVGVMTVNKYIHSLLYTDNDIGSSPPLGGGGDATTVQQFPKVQADGLTIQMVASGIVDSTIPTDDNKEEGWNRIKFVIADVGDRMLDSWLLLAGGSFKCEAIDQKDSELSNEVSLYVV